VEKVRKAAEGCDSLQSFFFMFSLGGGTGSGFGTYLLRELSDAFPDVYRFASVIFPSEEDDVVTSPYNSVLALHELTQHADCVLPLENQRLMDMAIASTSSKSQGTTRPFAEMNTLAARLLTDLTCSMRFEGDLNIDLNEITMNLVPFPSLKYLTCGLAPVAQQPSRSIDEAICSSFSEKCSFIGADSQGTRRPSTILAAGLLGRGALSVSDLTRSLGLLQSGNGLSPTRGLRGTFNMVSWNPDGFKIGLCSVPPLGRPYSVLSIRNDTCMIYPLGRAREKFNTLFKRKVYVHHYLDFLEESAFVEAREGLTELMANYEAAQEGQSPEKPARRYQPL
jgi:tubulin epsilon